MKAVALIAVFALCSLVVSALNTTPQYDEFYNYMVRYNKPYINDPQEVTIRRQNYEISKERIARLNQRAREAGDDTRFAINKFSDMSTAEFSATYFGYRASSERSIAELPPVVDAVYDIPTSYDWRQHGAVTAVKNQGDCGSCWAFSATEGVESAWFLAGNTIIKLAPQQIVSCDNNDDGCDGGDLPTAFAYVKSKGLEDEQDYPYTSGNSGDSGSCDYQSSDVKAHITGFRYATQSGNETAMLVALLAHGPLSICVDAETWQDYNGGIIKHGCGDSLDHCVQITGFNSTSGSTPVPYWIIRNSWGSDWGINGYLYVERNKDECGVSDEATYVVI
jgi:C1A family cysteine protease